MSTLDEKRELPHRESQSIQNAASAAVESLVNNGSMMAELEAPGDAPPAYGELPDQIQFSQPGVEAGAAVNAEGRVNININTKTRRLTDLITPYIREQAEIDASTPLPPAYIPPSLGGQPGQTPPPRLNVVIQIVGSRGDVQPFVALGKVLKETYGHRIRIATHPTFRSFVEEQGLDFFNIGGDPAELMAFMVRHPGLMPGFDAIKSGEVSKRRKGISEIMLGCWRSCIEAGDGLGPAPPRHRKDERWEPTAPLPGDDSLEPFVADAIIANPPSFAHIHVAEKLGIPLHMMFTMPWTATRSFPHPLADIQSSNADDVMTNYLSYTLVEMMTWQGLGDIINRFREKILDLQPLSLIWAPGLLNRLKIPYTYCWNIDISGFFFLDLATTYNPDPELGAFLESGPPPVYIGFGSIVVDDPNAMTELIFEAVRQTGVRALVSKGWGGLGAEDLGIPDGVFMLGSVPHDWLFKHVSCVVHHGGAGTTAAGIKAGKPTIVVPFFGDQPFWGAMIAKAGAGPDPIPNKQLTADKLAEAINFCLKPETIEKAQAYGEKIKEEKGSDVGGQCFHKHLDVDSMRCSLAPSYASVWRVRRSQVQLSPLAAAALVDEGILDYTDLKLFRARDYNTEDQPPDPISAAALSLITDASDIGLAIADMPREMFKSRSKAKTQTPPAQDNLQRPESSMSGATSAGASAVDASSLSSVPVETAQTSDNVTSISSQDALSPRETPRTVTDTSSFFTADPATTEATDGSQTRSASAQMKQAFSRRDSSPVGVGIDAAVGAGRSMGRVVTTGVKSPMNFCMGLAKGFRNVPRLYNDETVRPAEKVTGIGSGIKVAGKEFGLGLYDGISGLVMQPLKGAEKGGAAGLVKGFGKGIGGIVTKPAAGFWGIPAYTMKGVHAEVTKLFAKSNQNYIITSRVVQGNRLLRASSLEERNDILARWHNLGQDLRHFNYWKKKEKGKSAQRAPVTPDYDPSGGRGEPSRSSSWLSPGLKNRFGSTVGQSSSPRPESAEDAEFERAIQESVAHTSRGNEEEDAFVENAIRQSVNAVREKGGLPEPVPSVPEKNASTFDGASLFEDPEHQITDEEYQVLIEQAIQQSLTGHSADTSHHDQAGLPYLESGVTMDNDKPALPQRQVDDSELSRAIEESKRAQTRPSAPDDEAELQRAIEASKEEMERHKSERTEEDIVMEYVKKQSLAEEEFRKRRLQETGENSGDGDLDNEELKRAMEESLRLSTGADAGPSSFTKEP